MAAQNEPQTPLAGPGEPHQIPSLVKGKYKHVEHYGPGRWNIPLINDPIVEEITAEETKQALLKKQIQDEQDRITLKRDNFKSALKANQKKFSHFQKDLKSKHHDILNLKHELDKGLPTPPSFPNVEFFNSEPQNYSIDFNSKMMQHLQGTGDHGIYSMESEINTTILDPLRTNQANLKALRLQISILRKEKKIHQNNILTVKEELKTFQALTKGLDPTEEDIKDTAKEFNELETAKDRLDSH